MRVNKWTTLGGALMLASIAAFATLFSYGTYPAAAGDSTPEFTPDPTVCSQPSLAPAPCPTEQTPVKIKTHTPTATATAAATNTAAPTNTSAPNTNTPVPPATAPSGGQEGAGVRPPNTGTGDGTATASEVWAIVLGGALLAAGAGTFAVGMRRR